MKAFETADDFYQAQEIWQEELNALRQLILSTGLKEEVKWGGPTYTHQGKNIVGLAGFKSYFGIWFYQGVFLRDDQKKLINAQEGTTKALRQMRFTSLHAQDSALIIDYIQEAIANQEKGLQMKADRNKALDIPVALQVVLSQQTNLLTRFQAFKKTQQREFAEYIGSAKQEKTRLSRLERIIPLIENGIGLHDKYRKKP